VATALAMERDVLSHLNKWRSGQPVVEQT